MNAQPAAATESSPFHRGEEAVQSRAGVRDTIETWARQVVRPYMPQQHRDFYTQLPFVVAAARDTKDRPWATLLVGPPGFVQSPDDTGLTFASRPLPGDALEDSFVAGAELGLLGIELETRRRNRVNGIITEAGVSGLRFEVGQSFGNCPQYITQRTWHEVPVDPAAKATQRSTLDRDMQRWIASADTMFVASGYRGNGGANRAFGMDASHRGGPSGFVKVMSESRIVFPDYAGNNHFNTIGNLILEPRVGLLFVNFENGALLQISGKATIDWDSPDVARHPGAQRLVIVDVERVIRLDGILPLRFSEPQGAIRSLRLVQKIKESADVTSFVFEARDDGELPEFAAGQHLPVEFLIDGHDQPLKRTYSLSNGPSDGRYRISVKRMPHGTVSRHLHDAVEAGDILSATKPAGDFVLQCGERPIVLISAGIGVTPMISMLHALAQGSCDRPVYFIHGARDGEHHPLADEIRQVVDAHDHIHLTIAFSRPREVDRPGRDFDRAGHVDGDLIEALIPGLDADFYLCGPANFMGEIAGKLNQFGVDAGRIHTETF